MKKLKNNKHNYSLFNKAFTLIELLAVIIILAIVALIAVPIILNVVDDAKISAGRSEANMILSGINNYCATEDVKTQIDEDYVRVCTSSLDSEKVKEMVNIGNATIESIKYNGSKLTELIIKSNNHTFTLCPSGTFAMDGEKCEESIGILTTGPIKDVVLSNFPYLKTNGNGCVFSNDYNYSYMGGCYLKGNKDDFFSGKEEFLKGEIPMTKNQIEKKFFDSNGNFSDEAYDNYTMVENNFYTEQDLIDAGVETTFELDFNMTSEEAMKMSGEKIFYLFMSEQFKMDEQIITQTFFDSEGNFVAKNFENWYRETLVPPEVTEEEINEVFKQEGVKTFFELLMIDMMGKSMTSEQFFGLTGKDFIIEEMFKNGIPMSKEQIEEEFFDENGNFKSQVFEEFIREFLKHNNKTDEEINQMLKDAGVNTIFEAIFGMIPEQFFKEYPFNNSLWYSGFLWRIMGINADGTVRLITDENVTAIPWGASNTTENWDESYAKNWLNNYFYPRLKENNIIKEVTWCSETTTEKNSMRTICTNNLSTETAQVGLLTIDEYNLAGGTSSYLDIYQVQWTMTPGSSSKTWSVLGSGNAYNSFVSNSGGLRAVINVNSNVTITGGNGTLGATWSSQAGPYILNEDKNVEITGKLNEKATSGEYVLFAGKKYRVVDKDSNGNTKLILDGYYEEDGNIFAMKYNDTSTNIFSTTTGIGQKLNGDVLNWITNSNDTEKEKLVSNYTWYQNELDIGQSYTVSLDEENPTRSIQATIGLIRVGEMLSGQSSSMFTKGYNDLNNYNLDWYWTMTPTISSFEAWSMRYSGEFSSLNVSYPSGVRAVIVVKSDVTIIGGNGTWSNPYQI